MHRNHKRVLIIGSGPAGYAAAVYAARAALKVQLFAGEKSGGQLMLTTEVENFPGFPKGVMGPSLMMQMREQAERFGAVMVDRYVSKVDFSGQPFKVWVGEEVYEGDVVILSTGAESIMLNAPGENEYLGRGVSTCAVCDAAFFRNKKVYVVGGGDAAMEDAMALTPFTGDITLIHRRDSFRASKIMQQRVLVDHKDRVNVRWNSEVTKVLGNGQKITGIVVRDINSGKEEELPAEGLFIAIGHKPATEFLTGQVALDSKGYVTTRMSWNREGLDLSQQHIDEKGLVAYPTMTSVEGVFAGGDNVDFRYRQAITASAMGVMAALDAGWWLERQ